MYWAKKVLVCFKDKNTKAFQLAATIRKRKNYIWKHFDEMVFDQMTKLTFCRCYFVSFAGDLSAIWFANQSKSSFGLIRRKVKSYLSQSVENKQDKNYEQKS